MTVVTTTKAKLLFVENLCPYCNGCGYVVDFVPGCCNNADVYGNCCNRPILVPVQVQCERCCASGFDLPIVPSASLPAEQEAREYADGTCHRFGTTKNYTGQQVFEMIAAAYLSGKASGGDGIQPKQIFIHNTIEGCVDEIQTIEDAKAYVKDWYVEGESMHPDFYSFDILQKVGEVYAEIVGDVCLGLHVKTDKPLPTPPVK